MPNRDSITYRLVIFAVALLTFTFFVASLFTWDSFRHRFVFSLAALLLAIITCILTLYQNPLPLFASPSEKTRYMRYEMGDLMGAIIIGGIFTGVLTLILFAPNVAPSKYVQIGAYLIVDISFLLGGLLFFPGIHRFSSSHLAKQLLSPTQTKKRRTFCGVIAPEIRDGASLLVLIEGERHLVNLGNALCAIDKHDLENFFTPHTNNAVLIVGSRSGNFIQGSDEPLLIFATAHPDPQARLKDALRRYQIAVPLMILFLLLLVANFVLFFVDCSTK